MRVDEDDNDELKSFDGFRAYAKTVAFSVRTNVMYDGTLDDDSPVHGSAVRSPVIDIKILSINQCGITCGAIDEPSRSSKAIDNLSRLASR